MKRVRCGVGGIIAATLVLACGGGGGRELEPGPEPPTPNVVWLRTGGPPGGLGYDVRMRPDDPDVMLVTDAWAGVFRSTDGGASWAPTNTGITVRGGSSGDAIPIFCLTIDPHDPDIVWAGTQDSRGIFRSDDGGATWERRDNGIAEEFGITFRGFTVDPETSDVVYAAAELSSWVWAGESRPGREFDKTMGVVYRTTNGGTSWEEIWRGDNLARYVWIDPRDSQVLYVSTGIFDREAANSDAALDDPGGVGIVKSEDGGQTWQPANQGLTNLYVGTLYMHPENPDVLLAGTGNNAWPTGAGVFLTTNGGGSWTKVLSDEAGIMAVEIAQSAPGIMYAGNPGAIYRSDDGGTTWPRVTPQPDQWGSPGVQAGFPIDFQVDPRDPLRIFANNYGGGNFLSEDGGATWSMASAGYTGAQVRGLAADPSNPGRVIAAARSGLFGTADGGGTWAGLVRPEAHGLEWNAVAVDPVAPGHLVASNNWTGDIMESANGGDSWTQAGESALPYGFGWDVLTFAPSDPDVVYGGTAAYFSAGTFDRTRPAKGVYRSTNGGSAWSAANDTLSADAHVVAIAVHPGNANVVYAATANHGILRTPDGGGTWAERNGGLPASPRALSVAIDPSNPLRLYAGLESGGLHRSLDGGTTWQQVSVGLAPEASITDVVFDPVDPQTLYFSDMLSGVYRSQDGGGTWELLVSGLRTRAVNELDLSADGEHLYAATEGEGVFRLDLWGAPPAGP